MKNVIKKISAIALAFTLIGTGTAITKAIAPLEDNTLIASAEENFVPCAYAHGITHKCSEYQTEFYSYDYVPFVNLYYRYKVKACAICGAVSSKVYAGVRAPMETGYHW
ncbi:hypothetical protein [uncultured Ruminococcus sp.]|uniref:hypothetical protein n=1 Tax=uncultured Ruminococcus sp. TaxID=165186 RepID=UPI0025DC822E|nr:hypothetical protein [uncultured Ruminococcus sp.]